jgi:hypothetical protein
MHNLLEILKTANSIDKIILQLTSAPNDSDFELITPILANQIRNKQISIEHILNIMHNLHKYEKELLSWSGKLNEVIIWLFHNRERPEYLYNLIEKDPRKIRPLIVDLGKYLSELPISQSNNLIKDIVNNTNMDICDLYYAELKALPETSCVRYLMIFDTIEPEHLYDLLVKTCLEGHFLFRHIYRLLDDKNNSIKFFQCIQSRLNDNYGICLAIRQSPFAIDYMLNNKLQNCIFEKYRYIPQTITYIFKAALEQNCIDLLCQMGEVYSKKEILRALLLITEHMDNKIYVDRFIKKYKDHEEIKNLIPFI